MLVALRHGVGIRPLNSGAMRLSSMARKARKLYELELSLNDVEPRIWRRVLVRNDTFLPKVHLIIQVVMGWENYHLHEFIRGNERFGQPGDDFPKNNPKDEERVRLSQLLQKVGDTATYIYDFGDDWVHSVQLVNEQDWNPSASVSPVCIAGERRCPPEDVGGPPGYENYLAALGDSGHDMHDQYVEWKGPSFDSENFDINATNVRLGREVADGA